MLADVLNLLRVASRVDQLHLAILGVLRPRCIEVSLQLYVLQVLLFLVVLQVPETLSQVDGRHNSPLCLRLIPSGWHTHGLVESDDLSQRVDLVVGEFVLLANLALQLLDLVDQNLNISHRNLVSLDTEQLLFHPVGLVGLLLQLSLQLRDVDILLHQLLVEVLVLLTQFIYLGLLVDDALRELQNHII